MVNVFSHFQVIYFLAHVCLFEYLIPFLNFLFNRSYFSVISLSPLNTFILKHLSNYPIKLMPSVVVLSSECRFVVFVLEFLAMRSFIGLGFFPLFLFAFFVVVVSTWHLQNPQSRTKYFNKLFSLSLWDLNLMRKDVQ